MTRARMVDENLAHHPRAHGKELRTVLPLRVSPIRQAEIEFVYQRPRLTCMARAFARNLAVCQTFQLCEQDRPQLVSGGVFTGTPSLQESGDIVLVGFHWCTSNWR